MNAVHSIDDRFMLRALELAQLGKGNVSPNPLVGCVIVYQDKIIGEGWHRKYGEAHAEVNAVNSVTEKSLLKESTVYVTLEPCSHFGKTPPCADMLIREQVKNVVICNGDPNPLVAGKGIKKLREAKINVTENVLETEGRFINRRFFTFIERSRPYIILKWAQTADGFIARENFDSKWISDSYSRELVHKWRTEEDAVFVGSNTALHDNPKLNVRDWTGRNPVRILLDRYLKVPTTFQLFDQSQPTLCYNLQKEETVSNLHYVKLQKDDFIQQVAADLFKRKVQSVIIEGGAETLNRFIEANLWDEARIFMSPDTFDKGIPAPSLHTSTFKDEYLKNDVLRTIYNSQ
jgi:diaminohydroxyphosphoribosylaminopyrimidine deaminase/5-amino-6-(5-phosphoribosylamino)uracil reductase